MVYGYCVCEVGGHRKSARNRKEKVELLLNFPLIFARNKMRIIWKIEKWDDRKLDELARLRKSDSKLIIWREFSQYPSQIWKHSRSSL